MNRVEENPKMTLKAGLISMGSRVMRLSHKRGKSYKIEYRLKSKTEVDRCEM